MLTLPCLEGKITFLCEPQILFHSLPASSWFLSKPCLYWELFPWKDPPLLPPYTLGKTLEELSYPFSLYLHSAWCRMLKKNQTTKFVDPIIHSWWPPSLIKGRSTHTVLETILFFFFFFASKGHIVMAFLMTSQTGSRVTSFSATDLLLLVYVSSSQ